MLINCIKFSVLIGLWKGGNNAKGLVVYGFVSGGRYNLFSMRMV